MPIIIKTPEQIARLREAGRIVAETYEVLRPLVQPGVTTDRFCAEKIDRTACCSTRLTPKVASSVSRGLP